MINLNDVKDMAMLQHGCASADDNFFFWDVNNEEHSWESLNNVLHGRYGTLQGTNLIDIDKKKIIL